MPLLLQISFSFYIAFVLLMLCSVSVCSPKPYKADLIEEPAYESNGTIYLEKDGTMTYKPNVVDQWGLAYAVFRDGLLINGWGVLDVKSGYSSSGQSDSEVMYAAGFLEGALTYRHIYSHYNNIKGTFLNGKSDLVQSKLRSFLNEQQSFMEKMASTRRQDPLWRNVGLILSQYTGLVNGYTHVAPKEMALDNFAFQLLNGAGDLIDLMNALDKENRPDFQKLSPSELKLYIQQNSHCSALIKVLPAFENIFFSHSSWFVYQATDRIYKYYDFNVAEFASKKISFSSYPGFLESLDDFYMMGNGLVMLQTTNNVFNTSLYDLVVPQSIPAWIRVRVANQKSTKSEEWGSWLEKFNSGTYNNQYMVLDLNKVKLNRSIEDGALSVIEQIPGLVKYADQTAKLRLGYWPSYNVPYFEEVYNRSGYPGIVHTKGLDFSYQLAPRAKIFRRDADKVTDMDSMKHIMRYNDYRTDPYSENNPCDTICCRGDLSVTTPKASGCYDTKVSDYFLAAKNTAYVINGPSRGDTLQPFSWAQFKNATHTGLPNSYNFNFVYMTPIF